MDLSKYTNLLRDDFAAAAALGTDETRKTAAALATAIEPAARLMLLAALSDLAGEVSSALEHHDVDVRLLGTDARVVVTPVVDEPHASTGHHEPWATIDDVTGDISRVTLRLVEQIKAKAEEAASANGVSLNSWLSQAVQGALRDQMRRGGWNTSRAETPRSETPRSETPQPDATKADTAPPSAESDPKPTTTPNGDTES